VPTTIVLVVTQVNIRETEKRKTFGRGLRSNQLKESPFHPTPVRIPVSFSTEYFSKNLNPLVAFFLEQSDFIFIYNPIQAPAVLFSYFSACPNYRLIE
jgi:hypothetical protein